MTQSSLRKQRLNGAALNTNLKIPFYRYENILAFGHAVQLTDEFLLKVSIQYCLMKWTAVSA